MSRYLRNAATAVVNPPQSEPLNERQVPNSAGGYSFAIDKWQRLDRFLVLGSEGGSYYASEQKLTVDNIKAVAECVKEDGMRAVRRIVEISDAGRAPKNDPALLALAYAAGKGDNETRAYALHVMPKVARIGTHLFHFVDFVEQFRGWGRGLKNSVAEWYLAQDADKLADQVVKYQQRDGWSHRDLMRLTHKKFKDAEYQAIVRWVVKGVSENVPARIEGHIKLQACNDAKEAAALIRQYGLVRESVPTELLKDKAIWEALLEKMPMTAMIRNLGNMSKCGLLAPMSDAAKKVCGALTQENLTKARVHPIQVLIAQKTYGSGRGNRGSGEWTVVPQVVDALDAAFYLAFKNIEPSGKRFYLGLDVSGSMSGGEVAGVNGLTPRAASSAMAMVTARTESNYYVAGFQDRMMLLNITPKQRIDDICRMTDGLPFGATDCAQPMLDAMAKKIPVDVFAIYTDSETWAGDTHPTVALSNYRQKMGIPARLVVVGMVSNGFTIADPKDAGMLDVVGFDTATPDVISSFAAGKI